ncbi:MAG: hypothetical protein JWR37_1231 [Mycobacterium sp.]|nr:hypothetical protein [Mycobacterium sp.]
MRNLMVAAVLSAGLAVGGAALATSAQAAPCSYFDAKDLSSGRGQGICGTPNLQTTIGNAGTNLQNNFSPQIALKNLQANLSPSTANLQKNLGLGG